jgi:hypothetical protein
MSGRFINETNQHRNRGFRQMRNLAAGSFTVTAPIENVQGRIDRNKPCRCGSGVKGKKCCLKPVSDVVYDIHGNTTQDFADNPHGYAVICGGEDKVPHAELRAYMRGEHRHAPGKCWFLTSGDKETGKSHRFAFPSLGHEYARKFYPGADYMVVRLPKDYYALEIRFAQDLLFHVPE